MTRIEKSIEIKAPPEKVWEMITFDKAVEWMDEMEWQNVKYTSEVHTPKDRYRVGATAHITEKHAEYDCEITESTKNEKITFRSPSYNMITTYILEPVEEETKFTYELDYEFPYSIFSKIIDKLFFQRTTHKLMEKSLETLKSILEK